MGSTRCTSRGPGEEYDIGKRGPRIEYALTPFAGHEAPAVLSQVYLEGVYTEFYPNVAERSERHHPLLPTVLLPRRYRFIRHSTPRSLHEGRELGYSLSRAFGTVFDHPD